MKEKQKIKKQTRFAQTFYFNREFKRTKRQKKKNKSFNSDFEETCNYYLIMIYIWETCQAQALLKQWDCLS
jgi:hypothetical protein